MALLEGLGLWGKTLSLSKGYRMAGDAIISGQVPPPCPGIVFLSIRQLLKVSALPLDRVHLLPVSATTRLPAEPSERRSD